jgi:hypothetical protein
MLNCIVDNLTYPDFDSTRQDMLNCQINFTLEQAMKAHRGSRDISLLLL